MPLSRSALCLLFVASLAHAETIEFTGIPVNAYHRTMEEESANFSHEDFLAIWCDMCAIREFETVLNEIKTKGAYKGIAYNHAGPAHLSIGQEAAAVGMAFSLSPDDHVFGSHRAHQCDPAASPT